MSYPISLYMQDDIPTLQRRLLNLRLLESVYKDKTDDFTICLEDPDTGRVLLDAANAKLLDIREDMANVQIAIRELCAPIAPVSVSVVEEESEPEPDWDFDDE